MTRIELQDIFDRNDVPAWCYSFRGARRGDVYALEPMDGKWVLSYYDERGSREQEAVFDTESEGCLALLPKVSDALRQLQDRVIVVDQKPERPPE